MQEVLGEKGSEGEMKTLPTGRRHRSTREEKVDYMSRHPELWDRSPLQIKRALVEAGLLSPHTYVLDVRVPSLIKAAKKAAAR